jgi:hypothetical protein
MSVAHLNTYTIDGDLDNQLTIASVAASVGDVIVVFASGRTNTIKANWTTPTWNGETFNVLQDFVSADPTCVEVFILKCASSATANIVLNADQYTGCHGHAHVYSGAFGAIFYDAVVSQYVDTGTYSLPSIAITGMTANDIAVNALLATGWDAGYSDVSATTHTPNGTQRALTESTQPGSRRMYSATNTGTGSVTASYSKSSGSQPQFTLVGFRLYEAGASVTIDSTPTDIRIAESRTIRVTAPTTAMTAGNTSVKIDDVGNAAITPSAVTNISGLTYDVVFTVTDEYAGLPYSAAGYGIIVTTTDGSVTSSNVPFLPDTGNDYVTLTDVSATDIESSPALEVADQVEWTNAAVIDIDSEGKVTSSEASATFEFRVWDHDDSTWGDWAEATWGSGGSESNQNGVIVLGIINDGVIL